MPAKGWSRRDFVARTTGAAMSAMVVPRHVLGGAGHRAPSDVLNVAIVGAGGMGGENAQELGSEHILAVCDVDQAFAARKILERTRDDDGAERPQGLRWKQQYDAARKYQDFREMLAEEPELDAVVVATPDHTHAHIAKAAMEAGKHVYVQKPLAWSIEEARVLRDVARRTGVVTQMGNQGHSSDDARRVNEWVQSGVLGAVRHVHVWTNRPIWAQGLRRPAPLPADVDPDSPDRSWWPGSVAAAHAAGLWGSFEPPASLDWDLFVGPVAEDVPYHPIYHPFHWRGWTAFGVGALGDMGAHLVDHPFWALGLGYPESVEATSTPWGGDVEAPASYPQAMTVHYSFPRRGLMPPVQLHWYDGGLMPERPRHLPDHVALNRTGGVIFEGERGILMHETYGANPTLYPESLRAEAEAVPLTYARVQGSHEMNWADACRGVGSPTCPFEYAAPLTEVMLLGLVALRAGQGKKIEYDPTEMRIRNEPAADVHLRRKYRAGWAL